MIISVELKCNAKNTLFSLFLKDDVLLAEHALPVTSKSIPTVPLAPWTA